MLTSFSLICMTIALTNTRLHTNDLHSHLEGIGPDTSVEQAHGHFGRLKHLVNRLQKLHSNRTITVDAGDHFSGSLFHMLTISDALPCKDVPPIELKFFSDSFYDAVIMGNHDFDGGEAGALKILSCAAESTQVPILLANIELDTTRPIAKDFKALFSTEKPVYEPIAKFQKRKHTRLQPYLLKELYDAHTGLTLRVGILGVMGPDSAQCCTVSRRDIKFTGFDDGNGTVAFSDYVDIVYNTATMIRKKHKPDVIILVAHSGDPEDKVLVQSLMAMNEEDIPVIDVHISSHTHHVYYEKVGKTYMQQAHALGESLGVLQFSYDFETKTLSLMNGDVPQKKYFYIDSVTNTTLLPTIIPLNEDIPMDSDYVQVIDRYKTLIDKIFLKNQEFKYDTHVGVVPSHFLDRTPNPITGKYGFSNYLADCLFNETNAIIIEQGGHPLDVLIMSSDSIRTDDEYFLSKNSTGILYQFSDVYRTVAIGSLSTTISEEKTPGDVMAHFYISRPYIKTLITASKLFSDFINPTYALTFSSSMTFKTKWWGIPFYNRMYDLRFNNVPVEDLPEYLHVAMPAWMAKFFKTVPQLTHGWLDFFFHDRYGHILQDPMRVYEHEYVLFGWCIQRNKHLF